MIDTDTHIFTTQGIYIGARGNYVSRYLSSPNINLFATVEPVVLFLPSEGSCIESYIFMGIPPTPNPHFSKDHPPEVSLSPRFEWQMSDTCVYLGYTIIE